MGTHPIFESDFDCLTECVIICVDKMSFEVASAAGLEKFNKFLLDNSYVSGWTPTQKDVDIFKAIKSSPDGKYGNVLRWWKNIRATVPNLARSPPDLRLPPRKRKTMTSICSAQTTRKPSESRLSESPPTMRANRRRRTRRAKWWRRATSSSTSNRGTTKPRCQRWKNRSDRWKWTD